MISALRKLLVLLLVAAMFPLGLSGCNHEEHPKGEPPSKETGEHPEKEHPEEEEGEAEHPEKEGAEKEHPTEHPEKE